MRLSSSAFGLVYIFDFLLKTLGDLAHTSGLYLDRQDGVYANEIANIRRYLLCANRQLGEGQMSCNKTSCN